MPEVEPEDIYVWGWGGGVALAELTLAQKEGCHTAMIASSDSRLQLIKELGIRPIDHRDFPRLNFNEHKYKNDPAVRRSYLEAE